jgi:hypothetical protein
LIHCAKQQRADTPDIEQIPPQSEGNNADDQRPTRESEVSDQDLVCWAGLSRIRRFADCESLFDFFSLMIEFSHLENRNNLYICSRKHKIGCESQIFQLDVVLWDVEKPVEKLRLNTGNCHRRILSIQREVCGCQ